MKYLVLALPEPVLRHHDTAAEPSIIVVVRGDCGALVRSEQLAGGCTAERVEIGLDCVPVEPGDALFDGGAVGGTGEGWRAHGRKMGSQWPGCTPALAVVAGGAVQVALGRRAR